MMVNELFSLPRSLGLDTPPTVARVASAVVLAIVVQAVYDVLCGLLPVLGRAAWSSCASAARAARSMTTRAAPALRRLVLAAYVGGIKLVLLTAIFLYLLQPTDAFRATPTQQAQLRSAQAPPRAALFAVGGARWFLPRDRASEDARAKELSGTFRYLLVNLRGTDSPAGPGCGASHDAIPACPLVALPSIPSEVCMRAGASAGLSLETVQSPEFVGSVVRPRALHLADSGAGVHAINSMEYVIPGSLRPNTTSIATANGIATPPYRCDAVLSVLDGTGTSFDLNLPDAILMPDSQHNLVSLGLLAQDSGVETHIKSGDTSQLVFPCGRVVNLVNSGVLIIPDATAPACSAPSISVGKDGPMLSKLSYEVLHNRFNGRRHGVLKHLGTALSLRVNRNVDWDPCNCGC